MEENIAKDPFGTRNHASKPPVQHLEIGENGDHGVLARSLVVTELTPEIDDATTQPPRTAEAFVLANLTNKVLVQIMDDIAPLMAD